MSLAPVTTAIIVSLSTEAADAAQGKGLSIKPVVAGFVLGFLLIALATINDQLASYFSVLIIIVAALKNGPPIIAKL